MHSSVSMCQAAADTELHDFREVQSLMVDAVGSEDESDAQVMSVAKIAALCHSNAGCHRIRSCLALDSVHCFGLTAHDGMPLAATAELLCNASLIHDERHNQDKARCGCATAWAAYNDDGGICVGDLLFSTAYASRTTANFFAAGYPIYDGLCDFETDLERDTAAPVVNIVLVLQKNNALSTHEAWEAAQKLGLRHLETAATSSTDLPRQSGRLFREMANDLHSRLNDKCIQ